MLQLRQGVADGAFPQGVDPHQQSAGIVLTACPMRGIHQRAGGALQVGKITQQGGYGGIAQGRPYTVTKQHKGLALLQFTVQKIHHQILIQPQRPLEHMLHTRLVPDVIFADAPQGPGVPAVDPAITHMGQRKTPAAHDHSTYRGQQRLPAAIGAQPAILREQQTLQCLGDAPGFWCGVVVQRQCLQRRTGGQAAIGALADAIGNGK